MEHRYKLTYETHSHPEGVTAEQVRGARRGACDAVLMASVIFPEDGSYSCQVMSKDGRTGKELDDLEKFKAWIAVTKHLAESPGLDDGRRQFCAEVYRAILGASA